MSYASSVGAVPPWLPLPFIANDLGLGLADWAKHPGIISFIYNKGCLGHAVAPTAYRYTLNHTP